MKQGEFVYRLAFNATYVAVVGLKVKSKYYTGVCEDAIS